MSGRIGPNTVYITTGIFFGIAIVTSITRTAIRARYFRQFEIDDGLFLLAVATLIGGTTMLYINMPAAFEQQQVSAGLQAPPPNFLQKLLADQKIQQAATVLLGSTFVIVKLAFLLFFRKILERTNKRYVKWWWWVTVVIIVLSSPIIIFGDFLACPYTGEEILALARENAALQAATIVDIITDAFVVSIPALILKNLSLSVNQKWSLAGILCLSVFMMLCCIIKLSLANGPNGQANTLWLLMWHEMEGCVAVIVISVSAFKMLYTETKKAGGASRKNFWSRAGSLQWLLSRRGSSNAESERMGTSVAISYRNGSVDTLGHPVHYQAYVTTDKDDDDSDMP